MVALDHGIPLSRLLERAAQVRHTAKRVTPEEFRWQESHYDLDSRRGRELLFLIAHHEWVRATSEIVNVRRSDAVDTTISIDIDLDQITHEEYRGRTGRLWLPVIVLPPPRIDEDDANASPPNRQEPDPFTTVTDAAGGLLAMLPEADVRHQISAAVAEIIVNVAVARWPGADEKRPTATRDMRLLLSAAIYRLLRREPAVQPGAVLRADRAGLRSTHDRAEPPRIEKAKEQLDKLLQSYQDLLLGEQPRSGGNHAEHGDSRDRGGSAPPGPAAADRGPLLFTPELVLRAVMVLEALAQSVVVVVPVDRESAPTVLTVRVPTRRLDAPRTRSLLHPLTWWILRPRAHLQIDLLLPSAEADRELQLHLPDGVSLAESRMAGDTRTAPASMSISVERPQPLKDLAVLMELITKPFSAGAAGRARPAELQQCLADLASAKAGTVRETLRQYWDGPAPGIKRDPNSEEPWPELRALQTGLDTLLAAASVSEDILSDLLTAWTAFEPLMDKLLRRTWADSPGTRTVVARADMIEDVAQRAVPTSARLHIDVSVDDAEYLSVARFSGAMSLLVITAVLAFSAARLLKFGIAPHPEVLAIVLTLFSAIQAGRIERADRSTLRGLLSAVGNWLILASVLPAVILAIALTFFPSPLSQVIWAGTCTGLQLMLLTAMWRGPLAATGSPGQAQRQFSTRQPNYHFSEALRSDWWRSTTADALMIGRKAHAYVIWQEGTAPPLTKLLTHARKAGPPAAGSDSTATASPARPQADGSVMTAGDPASVLALLRSGTIGQEATFVAFREKPVSGWAKPAEAREVELDPDRLSPRDSVTSNVDIYVGLSGTCRQAIAEHPLVKILKAANHRLIVLEAQLPVPPPVAGYADRHWGRVRMALRDDQDIRRLDDFLIAIHGKKVAGDTPQHVIAVQLVPEAGPRVIVPPATSAVSGTGDLPAVAPGEMDVNAAHDGTENAPEQEQQSAEPNQRDSDVNLVTPATPLVLASDMDVVNTVANGDDDILAVTWRVLVICADASSNIETEIVGKLQETWPELQPVALTFGILYGTAVVLLLGHESGESSPPDVGLQAKPGSTPASQKLKVIVNEPCNRKQLGKAEKHPLLRVHFRSPDRPGELLSVLESLDNALNEKIPELKAAGGCHVSHAQTHVTTGQAALTRMTVRLTTRAADVAKWDAGTIEEIERKIRIMAVRETETAYDSDGSSGTGSLGAEDPVISVNVIRMPAT
jgi:hypothetical protein